MFDVFAAVVADHHFIGDHERLYEALGADGAPLSVGALRRLAVVLRHREMCAKLAGCTAFNEVCEREKDRRGLI